MNSTRTYQDGCTTDRLASVESSRQYLSNHYENGVDGGSEYANIVPELPGTWKRDSISFFQPNGGTGSNISIWKDTEARTPWAPVFDEGMQNVEVNMSRSTAVGPGFDPIASDYSLVWFDPGLYQAPGLYALWNSMLEEDQEIVSMIRRAGDALCIRNPPYGTGAVLVEHAPLKIVEDAHHDVRPAPMDMVSTLSPTDVAYSALSPPSSPVEDPEIMERMEATIGFVPRKVKLQCPKSVCAGRLFGRKAELRRHYETIHAARKPEFWCPVSTCSRSAVVGINTFRRKDKLKDHIGTVH